ncbi:MAG: DUF4399 domain-containing protein [Caldilineaceae bacterium]|nr:DUF4399 domain-containing protein [Caldilineaceae bacterium]
MNREFVARRFAHPSLGVMLLAALLVLAGCGGSAESPTPAATVLPTATLVATMAPPATPVPAEPTATAQPVAIEPTAEATATEEPAATETVTATNEVTATAEVTASEDVTATEAITASEATTSSDEVTSSEEATAAEEITTTEGITATEEVTASEEVSEADHTHETHAAIESAEVAPPAAFTSSAEITSTTALTAAAATSDTRVFFLQPTTNAVVPMTFTVVISYTGVTLAADESHEAGSDAHNSAGATNAGHVHLIIDSDFIPAGEMIPADELHHHFSDGSTSTELSLAPGSHILRLQYADNSHTALEGDQYRQEIVVNVVDGAPEQAVRIVSPTSGATVPVTFTVVMAASGINVEPAGPVNENAGHFHLLIDEPFVAAGEIIPADDTHLHFGKAQLTTTLTLEPGSYLLRLQLADGTHHALSGDQYRAEVAIIVAEDAPAEQVMFVKPADGATVTSPFLVGWAASGLIIEAAGSSIRPNAGHLHLLINEEFVAGGEAIPTDETHLHFGKGQTSTELTLEPGKYTLRLQMANGAHIAQDGPQYHDEITVTVK